MSTMNVFDDNINNQISSKYQFKAGTFNKIYIFNIRIVIFL